MAITNYFLARLWFIKKKFKQWWSTIQSISTKRTISCHLNSL